MSSPLSFAVSKTDSIATASALQETVELSGCLKLEETIISGETRRIFIPKVQKYLAGAAAVAASYTFNAVKVEAVVPGAVGNNISVVAEEGSNAPTTTFTYNNGLVTIILAKVIGVKATCAPNTVDTWEAVTAGTTANNYVLNYVVPSGTNSTCTFNKVGNFITVNLRTENDVSVTTAANLAADFAADSGIAAIKAVVNFTGTDNVTILSTTVDQPFTGGINAVSATASSVVADFATASSNVTNVVNITVSGNGSTAVNTLTSHNLAGGADTGLPTSQPGTLADIKFMSIVLANTLHYVSPTAGIADTSNSVVFKIIDDTPSQTGIYKLDAPVVIGSGNLVRPGIDDLLSGYPTFVEFTNNKAVPVVVSILVGFNTL